MQKVVDAVAQVVAVGVPAVVQVVDMPHPILPIPVPPWLNVFKMPFLQNFLLFNKPFLQYSLPATISGRLSFLLRTINSKIFKSLTLKMSPLSIAM